MVARKAIGREEPEVVHRQVRRQVCMVGRQGSNDGVFRHELARSNGGA